MATHLILCSHLRSISPLILYHIQDLVHHIAWKGLACCLDKLQEHRKHFKEAVYEVLPRCEASSTPGSYPHDVTDAGNGLHVMLHHSAGRIALAHALVQG